MISEIEDFREKVRRKPHNSRDLSDAVERATASLVAIYAMPLFQRDYELVVREGDSPHWVSVSYQLSALERYRIHRYITTFANQGGLEVKITVPMPCSFVSLGFLDGGAYRSARAHRHAPIMVLIGQADSVKLRYGHRMWIASTAWLDKLVGIVREYVRASATPMLEYMALLGREAEANGLTIAVSGWRGPSRCSDLMPVAWERRTQSLS
jgi:hypothetical protein